MILRTLELPRSSHFSPGGTGLFWPQGNFDGDEDVDLADYNHLAGDFRPGGYGAPVHEVPEPTSLVLGMLFLPCTMRWLATCGALRADLPAFQEEFTGEIKQIDCGGRDPLCRPS